MQWIRENWFWIIVAIAFVWMHLKMHGSHGSHGAHSAHTSHREDSDHGEH